MTETVLRVQPMCGTMYSSCKPCRELRERLRGGLTAATEWTVPVMRDKDHGS